MYIYNTVVYKAKPFKYYLTVCLFSFYFLFFGSNILSLTPLAKIYTIGLYLYIVGLVLFGGIYYLDRVVNKKSLTLIDVLVIWMCITPIYPAIMANQVFGQSLFKGILTVEKTNITLMSSCFIYYLIRNGSLRMEEYNRAMLILCWLSLVMYIYLMNTINPAAYQDTGLVGYNPSKGGWVFRFSPLPIVYGISFYFLEFIFFKKKWSLLLFTGLFGYIVFIDKSRITIVETFGVLMLYMLYALPILKTLGRLLYLAIFFGIMLYIVWLIKPELLEIVTGMLQNFFLAILGVDTGEGSADVRWIEMAKVWDFFDKYPGTMITGVGQLNKEFMEREMGELYLSDIGIVGIFFVYGVIGTALQYLYFAFGTWLAWGNKNFKNDLFFHAAKLGLLNMFVDSFFTGGFVWVPTSLVNILLILRYFQVEDRKIEAAKKLAIETNANA